MLGALGKRVDDLGQRYITDSKIYLGFVKSNVDVQKMGRLAVYIPELGTAPDDSNQWHIASYASPFAGASSIRDTIPGSHAEEGSQHSYGFWMVPPDLENQVLVLFINGEASKCVWFACLYQQNMNHMVPGIASDNSFQEGVDKVLPPVVEYNKDDPAIDPASPIRPRFNALHSGLSAQGLYSDFERGPSSGSARRESPSKVFGFNTPRANCIYIDDDPSNELIRLRTRSGTQILVHETNGYVYINSGSGNSWIEVSDDGIDIYSKGSVSMRAEQDFNVRAERNINLDAGGTVNITATKNINSSAGAIMNNKAGSKINEDAPTINNYASTHNTKASTVNRDGKISDNNGAAAASSVTAPATIARSDIPEGMLNTTVSRMPTHEPFALHPKSKNIKPPIGDLPASGSAAVGGGGSGGGGTGPSQKNQTVNDPPTVNQKTGDGGNNKVVLDDASKSKLVAAGNSQASERVIAAIRRASDMTGVDFGYLMAMCEKESTFNPNARAPTSSAKGLFQFTDETWAGMRKNYPQYGIGPNDQFNPEANALMGALLTKENSRSLKVYGVSDPSPADLYLAHFAGPSNASKLIKAPDDANAAQIVGTKASNANKTIFFSNGQAKTAAQVTGNFSNFITPRAVAYADFGSKPKVG
jgi:hypothetical protein